jgi:mRNA interferase RelE/StbE
MYSIKFSQTAHRQLKKLENTIQKRIILSLEKIRIRPERYVTKLVGDPAFKLKVGKYRIIIDIYREELIILVIKLGHRKNIYK